jgi:putative redox protein
MKTVVDWRQREHPHEFEFQGTTDDGLTVEIGARSVADGPKTAPTPKELVAMAMGSCSGIDVVSTLRKMRQPLVRLRVSCDIEVGTGVPAVFERCLMTYEAEGEGLSSNRVAHAVKLSFDTHCGVSIMIKRGGCEVAARLLVNGVEVPIA